MTVRDGFHLLGLGFMLASGFAVWFADDEWRVVLGAFAVACFLIGFVAGSTCLH